MRFKVLVRKNGAEETETIEAASRFAVYEQVHTEGGTVINIWEKSPFISSLSSFNITIGTGVKQSEVMRMAKNLSAMLSAGLSLPRSLSIIERQSRGRFKEIARKLGESVNQGASFHETLATEPKIFSALLISMVKAGEESGSLADTLATVATQMEHSEQLTKKIRGAMIYPSIIIIAIIIIAVLMLIYVVPTLTKTFTDLGVQVPLATRIIADISDFMAANAIAVLIGLVAFFAGVFLFIRSKAGKAVILRVGLYIPVIGTLVRETFAARASRTLSSLLTAGVPLLTGIGIVEEVVGAKQFAAVIAEAKERVRKGDSLSGAFAAHPKLYPLLMSDMLAVGEETGKMAEMLRQVAIFYETDVEQQTKDLSTIIEPVLMLIIGLAVGVFAVAMIQPIYSLSSAI